MAYFPSTYIPKGMGSTPKMSHFIDDLLTPRIMAFRHIKIADEQCELRLNRKTWYVTYGNWLGGDPQNTIRKGGQMVAPVTIDYVHGEFTLAAIDLGADLSPRDVVEATYSIDYFPPAVLEGFLTAAVSVVNMSAVGPPTSYTISNAPTNWEGVITDLAFAMCMEKLLLDYDLWRYRLIFAIGPGDVYGGGSGDIAGQLTTLKQNAEQRAEKAMDNPKFKTGNYTSPPTAIYYQSIRGFGTGSIGGVWQGKLHGWKPNRWI
jgi:hypothetical protein